MKFKELINKREFKIFLTIYLVYLVFMTNYGGNFMADSMLSATISLIEQRTLVIDDYVSEVCKETGCDHSYYKGHYYSGFAPGPSFLALPVYLIAYPFLDNLIPDFYLENTKTELKLIFLNILVTIFISSLLGAFTGVLIYKISDYFTKNERNKLITTFVFSFCTIFFLYSTGYYLRTLAAFFSLFAFYKLIKMKHSGVNNKDLFLSGLFSSIAISMDYVHFIISFVLFLYLLSFLRNKKISYFIISSIIPILLVLAYHYIIFDNIFTTPEHLRANLPTLNDLSIGLGGFNYPHLDKLFLYSFSPKRGLFFYMPILLLSIYGLYLGLRKNKFEILTIFFSGFLTYLFYSSSVWPWWWDGSFGPRYLLVTVPYLILGLNFTLEKTNKFLFYIFLIPSFFISLLGAMYDRTGLWSYPFDVPNPLFNTYIPLFLKRGFSNYTLNIIDYKIINLPIYLINILFFIEIIILFLIIKHIWKENTKII